LPFAVNFLSVRFGATVKRARSEQLAFAGFSVRFSPGALLYSRTRMTRFLFHLHESSQWETADFSARALYTHPTLWLAHADPAEFMAAHYPTEQNPCHFVICGATGNLASQKLIPALFRPETAVRIPRNP